MADENMQTPNPAPDRRRPWILATVALLAALAGIAVALRLIDNNSLPQARLTTRSGNIVQLRALSAGKPLVVNLWATWCPPCRLELPFLAAAQKREAGIAFVFVDQGEDAVTVERYLGSARLELANVLLDAGAALGREIGSSALPVTLFYDASGRMVDSHLGALSPSLLADKLTRLRPAAGATQAR